MQMHHFITKAVQNRSRTLKMKKVDLRNPNIIFLTVQSMRL